MLGVEPAGNLPTINLFLATSRGKVPTLEPRPAPHTHDEQFQHSYGLKKAEGNRRLVGASTCPLPAMDPMTRVSKGARCVLSADLR